MGKKDKVLVFGTGSLAVRNLNILKKMNIYDEVEILGFLDNNSAKWGSKIDKYNIYSVNELQNIEYDYICIWSSYKSEIRKQLIETLNIEKNKIKEIFIEYLESVITKYKYTIDIEIKNILEKMKK